MQVLHSRVDSREERWVRTRSDVDARGVDLRTMFPVESIPDQGLTVGIFDLLLEGVEGIEDRVICGLRMVLDPYLGICLCLC